MIHQNLLFFEKKSIFSKKRRFLGHLRKFFIIFYTNMSKNFFVSKICFFLARGNVFFLFFSEKKENFSFIFFD